MDKSLTFKNGIKDGIPIALGYLAVAFAFGVTVVAQGLPELIAVITSATNFTSAGQLAGATVIIALGSIVEIILTQLVINARYFLMSLTLSQRLNKTFTLLDRFLCAFGISDEIFAVAVSKKEVSRNYMYGLILLPYLSWTVGTLIGALAGNVLPSFIMSSLQIALYAMFIAIIIPSGLNDKKVWPVIALSIMLSVAFYFLPVLKNISSGFAYILCAIVASSFGAIVFPLPDDIEDTDKKEGDVYA